MDELMDKNLPYFVGGNLATLRTTSPIILASGSTLLLPVASLSFNLPA